MKENNFIKKVKKKNLSKKNSKEIRHDDPSLTPNQHHQLKKKSKEDSREHSWTRNADHEINRNKKKLTTSIKNYSDTSEMEIDTFLIIKIFLWKQSWGLIKL